MQQHASDTHTLSPTTRTAACRVAQRVAVADSVHTRRARRHVVHVSPGTDVGGLEKLLVDFARHIDRERFQLTFVSLGQRGRLAAALEEAHWPVYALDKPSGVRPRAVWNLARRLRKLRPDVVHTHNTAAFVYGVPAARLARVPKIIHTRHGQRYAASARETWLFRSLARFIDQVVAVSDDGCQLSISEGIRPDRVCLIRNGVDLQRYAYAGPTDQGPATLVARLSPEKDVATLLRALPHVIRLLGPQASAFRLTVVGDGTDRAALERMAQDLGLGGVVRFLGIRHDIPELLGQASMFVLPSLTEGISLTLLEAMARGLPVVATRVGGNPEVVWEGKTGLLVPAQDPVALAWAIAHLYRCPDLAREMGSLGRQRVEELFSVQHMLRQYERHYADEGSL